MKPMNSDRAAFVLVLVALYLAIAAATYYDRKDREEIIAFFQANAAIGEYAVFKKEANGDYVRVCTASRSYSIRGMKWEDVMNLPCDEVQK